jgi:hypothetical protein
MKKIFVLILALLPMLTMAGTDLSGKVERMAIRGDGNLWIKLNNASFDTYCKPGWFGFNLYIPTQSADYPYFYGLVTTALAQDKTLYIANISTYNGSTACDLTKTSFGIVMLK